MFSRWPLALGVLCIILGASVSTRAETAASDEPTDARALLDTATRAYESGDFAGAISAYERLRAMGYAGADILYNLGNAYFKGEDLGRAIVNYERALLLAPRDRDLLDNLELARERCVDKRPDSALGAGGFAAAAFRRLTPDEWAWVFAIGLLLTLLVVIAPYYTPIGRTRARRIAAFCASLMILGVVGMSVWAHHARAGSRGVVIARPDAAELSVRSGPGTTYLGEFSLHPGSVVRVIDERDGWLKIAFSPSLRGWAEANGVERL
ncbi:MAG: tetratricopeptide repeat protein [bacterium]